VSAQKGRQDEQDLRDGRNNAGEVELAQLGRGEARETGWPDSYWRIFKTTILSTGGLCAIAFSRWYGLDYRVFRQAVPLRAAGRYFCKNTKKIQKRNRPLLTSRGKESRKGAPNEILA
jgi:hypothetical protein